jgi:drug/metabolite transporter (DMT)-like permease
MALPNDPICAGERRRIRRLTFAGAKAPARAGIPWMLGATFLFVCQDSTARILLDSYPATEIGFARYFVHLVLVAGFLAWREPRLMVSRRPVLQMLRSSLLLANTLFGFMALKIMPFLDFSAVAWIAPVLVTALSIVLLGEKVSLRGWLSVLIGFAGVWIIVAKASLHVSPLMLFPLLAALSGALYQIATRKLHAADSPLTTLLYTAVAGSIFCALFLPLAGVAPKPADLALMTMLGGLGVASHFCMIRAF